MRKKIAAMCMAVLMGVGISACGASSTSEIATITLEGIEYDLSGDFQEVVGKMASDGINVVYMLSGIDRMIYDEDGMLVAAEDFDKDDPNLYAIERHVTSSPIFLEMADEVGTFVYKQYILMGENIDFSSKLGIDNDTSKSDMKDLDVFEDSTPVRNLNSKGYVAVFVDGEAVDFADYEEALEDWKDDCDDDGFAKACEKNLDNAHYATLGNRMLVADFVKFAKDFDELKEYMNGVNISAEDEMILALVMQDACEKLEEGEAESVVVVKVEIADKDDDRDTIMEYTEYYFAEDWDQEKFKKKD